MNHNRIPDNDELARRLATAFDALPGPDEERLEAVRARLASQLKRPSSRSHGKRWIWLLLLIGGTATAAWWVGETWWQQSVDEPPLELTTSATAEPTATVTEKDSESSGQAGTAEDSVEAPADEQRSPVIYEREGY